MIVLLFSLLCFANGEGDLKSFSENDIPQLLGRKATTEAQVSYAESYWSGGTLAKAFPNLINKPLLSPAFVGSRLGELQLEEESINLELFNKHCSGCEVGAQEQLAQIQKELLASERLRIGLERNLLALLHAQLIDNPNYQHSNINQHVAWWSSRYDDIEIMISAAPDNSTDEIRHAKREIQIIAQHLSSVTAFSDHLVAYLTIESNDSIFEWSQEWATHDRNSDELSLRSDYEISQQIQTLPQEEIESIKGALVSIEEEYQSNITQKISGYDTRVRSLILSDDEIGLDLDYLNAVNESIQGLRDELQQEQDRFQWLDSRLAPLFSTLAEIEADIDERIQRQELLSISEHQEEVRLAQEQLKEAIQQKETEKEATASSIHDTIIQFREEIQRFRQSDKESRTQVGEKVEAYNQQIEQFSTEYERVKSQSPLNPEKQISFDALYLQLDELILSLRQDLFALDVLDEGNNTIQIIEFTPEQEQENADSVLALKEAKGDYFLALSDHETSRSEESFTFVSLLESSKSLRRLAYGQTTSDALQKGRYDFWEELKYEYKEQPYRLRYYTHIGLAFVAKLPKLLLRVDILFKIIQNLFLVIVIFGGWSWARSRWPAFIKRSYRSVQDLVGLESVFDSSSLDARQAEGLCLTLLDGLVFMILYGSLSASNPILALLILVAFCGYLVRWTQKDLPQVEQPIHDFFRTVLSIIAWLSAAYFLSDIAINILSSDRLDELIEFLKWTLFFPLIFWVLLLWSERAQQNASIWVVEYPAFSWVGRLSNGIFSKLVWSLVGSFVLGHHFLILSSLFLIETTGWLGSAIAKNSISQTEVIPNQSEQLGRFFSSLVGLYQLEEEELELQSLLQEWKEIRSNGVIALIGDKGTGKTTLLSSIHLEGFNKLILSPPNRMTTTKELEEWLSSEVEAPDNRTLKSHFLSLAPALIVIDRLDSLFLRSVGGYEALYTLSQLMQETASHHCWVVGIHLHTWNFLRAPAIPFKSELFHSSVVIQSINAQKCSTWAHQCAKENEIEINFSQLLSKKRSNRFLKQTEKSYWRLLVDTAIYNPSTIRRLWLSSLHYEESERVIYVHYFQSPTFEVLNDINIHEQFILSSLLIHGDLNEQQLSSTLSISDVQVKMCCRNLMSKDILVQNEQFYMISFYWHPVVIQFLQQKHLLGSSS